VRELVQSVEIVDQLIEVVIAIDYESGVLLLNVFSDYEDLIYAVF
jgi:hypothetical protein